MFSLCLMRSWFNLSRFFLSLWGRNLITVIDMVDMITFSIVRSVVEETDNFAMNCVQTVVKWALTQFSSVSARTHGFSNLEIFLYFRIPQIWSWHFIVKYFATLFNYFYTLPLNTTCVMIGNGQRVVISFKIVFALLSVYFIFTGKWLWYFLFLCWRDITGY